MDIYGQGAGYGKRAFLVYTGLHFDAAVFVKLGQNTMKIAPSHDSAFVAAASRLASELKSQGNFSNKDTLRLRCKICNITGKFLPPFKIVCAFICVCA